MTLGFVCTPTCRGTSLGGFSNLLLERLARELVTKWVRKNPPTGHTICSDDFGAGVEARGRRVRRAHAVAARREASPLDDGLARRRAALGDERLRGVEQVVEGDGVDADSIEFSKNDSKQKTYTSVTIKAPVASAEELYQCYAVLRQDPRVKIAL